MRSFSDDNARLLCYADLLSLSSFEEQQNIAQQIVIILSHLYPKDKEVQLYKESVYRNVSNFASLHLIGNNDDAPRTDYGFLRDFSFNIHQESNRLGQGGITLFDTQIELLKGLTENQYFSFSAPTSMGKTFVIENYIKEQLKKGTTDNFAIVVPTRALLNEIANSIISIFAEYLGEGRHKIITTTAAIEPTEHFVAVLTPERLYYSLLKQPDIKFNQLFIDEAHKISEKDKRSIIYYKILDMVKNMPKVRVYFSSPVIPNPDIYLELTNFFTAQNQSNGRAFEFSPVVQNKVLLDFESKKFSCYNNLSRKFAECGELPATVTNKMKALLALGKAKCNLIYVSSANKAVNYAKELCDFIKSNYVGSDYSVNDRLERTAAKIKERIHNEYYLAECVRFGVAYHIGALPAEIRLEIESLIRAKLIRYCFCTSTLLEGVNVPVDNLFIFDYKKGRSKLTIIDAFNLMGRSGRVTLNESGNVFLIVENNRYKEFYDTVLLQPLPKQELLPKQALTEKHKKYIISRLLDGKTNLLDKEEKYSDKDFSETTYEYATKCLNMLLHDICAKNESFMVKAFIKKGHLTPQNIIDIRTTFGEIVSEDDDINVSAIQKDKLYKTIKKTTLNYPTSFDYSNCVSFLLMLKEVFQWELYERDTLGKGDKLNYYAVILTQWMNGNGMHEIIRQAILHYRKSEPELVFYEPDYHKERYDGTPRHNNYIINEVMKDIEQIVNYKFSMYFLRLSEAIIKIRGKNALVNDWFEFVEYGTSNKDVIRLQKHGFTREQSLSLLRQTLRNFLVRDKSGDIMIKSRILTSIRDEDIITALKTVQINYPELFIDSL
jgi:superfamily II DNA/RNA helicase